MAPQGNTGTGAEAELPEYAGHYRLESCLGSGGMGVVHVARSTSGMKLAVKVVHTEFAKDPEFRGRFRQEVAAARKVSGAFTASVVDADPDAERPWMATLFIPGPTLSDEVKRNGPMAPDQLRRLMAGLAEALRDIHRVGVVHRDLKPSNVLLAEDGPKVIDFGISRPKDSELRTETGKLIGTPPFMAPEQFRRPREVGPAADIFALGSVMVHAATGRGPFDSDSPYVVAYQVVHDEPDLTGVPTNLAPLIVRCLAKEPEDRPTPDELMRELRSVAASYDTQTFIPAQRTRDVPGAEPKEQLSRSGRRPSRRTVFVAVAVVLTLAGVLASVQWLGGGEDATAKSGDKPTAATGFAGWTANPVPKAEGPAQCSYGAGRLICAQSGTVFALDPADGALMWRHSVAESRLSKPPAVEGGLVQPMVEEGRRLEGLDPASGKARWQRALPRHHGMQITGGMLLLTLLDGTVTGVDAATGDTKWHLRIPGQPTPAFVSFDGDPLAYTTNLSLDGLSTRVTAVDPTTGAVRWDARLSGNLVLVGTHGGSVFFLSTNNLYGDTEAVVRYTPATESSRRVKLPVARSDVQATARGNTVYLLASTGSLDAVDTVSGKRLWNLETSVSRGSVPVADDRHVYFTTTDGRLFAVDADKGRLVGQTPARLGSNSGTVTGALPSPTVADGRIYATAPDGTVFAVTSREPSGW
ncbi:serine/threonine-protein kinase [Streptomyces pseudovenezuelae]|uniref:serine/threonine-protein kinase n=1 Tax=Streptomyces pseudovenezuelae TaxID=67350 RepID=UPI002E8149A6|nr:serine/threonine-protein kinase [Streptomyces pseudovenezuelae]WUA89378.1 serine/threonine-protein kinase [Streptomyces pseudovenezuelae]